MSIERVRVEEFGESKMKIVDESILFFSRVSLRRLSTIHGYKGIYSRVYEECEESVTTKQGVLATRARDWNESRV